MRPDQLPGWQKQGVKPPTESEYKQAKYNMLSAAMDTHPCRACKWPVIDGYCCDFCGSTNP